MAFRKDAASILKYMRDPTKFDKVLEKVKILSLENGKCSAELKIEEEHTNVLGGLHGGLSATLVDCISGYALMTQIPKPNLSVDIHLSFLKAVTIGDEIQIEANVVKKGKRVSFLEVYIRNKATHDLLVKGSHTKFSPD